MMWIFHVKAWGRFKNSFMYSSSILIIFSLQMIFYLKMLPKWKIKAALYLNKALLNYKSDCLSYSRLLLFKFDWNWWKAVNILLVLLLLNQLRKQKRTANKQEKDINNRSLIPITVPSAEDPQLPLLFSHSLFLCEMRPIESKFFDPVILRIKDFFVDKLISLTCCFHRGPFLSIILLFIREFFILQVSFAKPTTDRDFGMLEDVFEPYYNKHTDFALVL